MSDKVDERLKRREERYDRERRVRVKVGEDLETLEEVFDGKTLMTIFKMLNDGQLRELTGVVKSGKESRVYHGVRPDGQEVAVKIFLTSSAIFKQGRLKYIAGDPRFKDIPHDTRSLVEQWTLKEFKNLQLATEAGIRVPKPILVEENVLVMDFIGKNGVSAPKLRFVPLDKPVAWYKSIVEMVTQLYKEAKLVHGDISEYNILVPNGYPVLIDFAQAVTIEHPEAREFLKRDIENLNHYFNTLKVKTKPFQKIFPAEEP